MVFKPAVKHFSELTINDFVPHNILASIAHPLHLDQHCHSNLVHQGQANLPAEAGTNNLDQAHIV